MKKAAMKDEKPVKRFQAPRGQAMVEYTIVAHAMLLGTTLALLPMVSLLLEALSAYYESLYFVLRTAAI